MVEPLQNILKHMQIPAQFKKGNPEEWIHYYEQHPVVRDFINRNPDIKGEDLARSLTKIDQAVREAEACANCPGLSECPNIMQGHCARLTWTGMYVEVSLRSCDKWEAYRQQRRREKLVEAHYVPKHILAADFEHIEQDAGRTRAIEALIQFCLSVRPGQEGSRGIYLYGPFGVGKSYIMAAAARELAKRDIHSFMVYTPDFFREMKSSIQDHTLQDKLNVYKQVPVLIFDDIGAETMSPWMRDEVLAPILQYRANENLPTLYTSNYDYDLLEEHLSYSEKGGTEELKAKRIMERIRRYTDIYAVKGPNRR